MNDAASKRPNVVLITADELRWDCYAGGQDTWLHTPNINRLAAEGVTLPNCYSNSRVCMPTRYTWLTGLYASQTERGPRNGYDFPTNLPTFVADPGEPGHSRL